MQPQEEPATKYDLKEVQTYQSNLQDSLYSGISDLQSQVSDLQRDLYQRQGETNVLTRLSRLESLVQHLEKENSSLVAKVRRLESRPSDATHKDTIDQKAEHSGHSDVSRSSTHMGESSSSPDNDASSVIKELRQQQQLEVQQQNQLIDSFIKAQKQEMTDMANTFHANNTNLSARITQLTATTAKDLQLRATVDDRMEIQSHIELLRNQIDKVVQNSYDKVMFELLHDDSTLTDSWKVYLKQLETSYKDISERLEMQEEQSKAQLSSHSSLKTQLADIKANVDTVAVQFAQSLLELKQECKAVQAQMAQMWSTVQDSGHISKSDQANIARKVLEQLNNKFQYKLSRVMNEMVTDHILLLSDFNVSDTKPRPDCTIDAPQYRSLDMHHGDSSLNITKVGCDKSGPPPQRPASAESGPATRVPPAQNKQPGTTDLPKPQQNTLSDFKVRRSTTESADGSQGPQPGQPAKADSCPVVQQMQGSFAGVAPQERVDEKQSLGGVSRQRPPSKGGSRLYNTTTIEVTKDIADQGASQPGVEHEGNKEQEGGLGGLQDQVSGCNLVQNWSNRANTPCTTAGDEVVHNGGCGLDREITSLTDSKSAAQVFIKILKQIMEHVDQSPGENNQFLGPTLLKKLRKHSLAFIARVNQSKNLYMWDVSLCMSAVCILLLSEQHELCSKVSRAVPVLLDGMKLRSMPADRPPQHVPKALNNEYVKVGYSTVGGGPRERVPQDPPRAVTPEPAAFYDGSGMAGGWGGEQACIGLQEIILQCNKQSMESAIDEAWNEARLAGGVTTKQSIAAGTGRIRPWSAQSGIGARGGGWGTQKRGSGDTIYCSKRVAALTGRKEAQTVLRTIHSADGGRGRTETSSRH